MMVKLYRGDYLLDKFLDMSLVQRISCGIIVGIIVGIFTLMDVYHHIGDCICQLLKSHCSSLGIFLTAASIAKHKVGNETYVKPILFLYLGGTFLSALVAVVVSSIFTIPITLQEQVSEKAPQNIGSVLSTMLTNVTQNPIKAIIESNYLGVLFWAVLLGLALRSHTETTKEVVDQVSVALSYVVQLIIAFAPIGILGLVYQSISTTGLSGLAEYLQLVLVLVGTMLFVALVVYPLLTFLFIKKILSIDFLLLKSAVPASLVQQPTFYQYDVSRTIEINKGILCDLDYVGRPSIWGRCCNDYRDDIDDGTNIRDRSVLCFKIDP